MTKQAGQPLAGQASFAAGGPQTVREGGRTWCHGRRSHGAKKSYVKPTDWCDRSQAGKFCRLPQPEALTDKKSQQTSWDGMHVAGACRLDTPIGRTHDRCSARRAAGDRQSVEIGMGWCGQAYERGGCPPHELCRVGGEQPHCAHGRVETSTWLSMPYQHLRPRKVSARVAWRPVTHTGGTPDAPLSRPADPAPSSTDTWYPAAHGRGVL